jgi:hypothetical protein
MFSIPRSFAAEAFLADYHISALAAIDPRIVIHRAVVDIGNVNDITALRRALIGIQWHDRSGHGCDHQPR